MMMMRKTDTLKLLVLSVLLITDVTCRPLLQVPERLPRQVRDNQKGNQDSGKTVKDSGLPKDDVKKDEDDVLFEGDILMPRSEWLAMMAGDEEFESDYETYDPDLSRKKRQADVPVPTTELPTTALPTTALPTTALPTTALPTTALPTTVLPTTALPTAASVQTTPSPHSPPSVTNNRIWPNCRIPFKYEQFIDAKTRMLFMMAMSLWEQSTCISFEHATIEDHDYLFLKKSSICSSHVGRRGGGPQEVTIADGCYKVGNAAHELGHAIGLWHEHSRPDRDQYIDIHHDNLPRNEYHNFDLIKKDVFEQVPDVGYDIQSVMHYGPYTFTNNGNKTITIKEDAKLPELNCTNTLPMGQREQLSYKDKKRASLLYNCDFDLEEPECIQPTPTTPPPTTDTPTTVMPVPSTTTKAPTPPPLSKKLYHGNVIALTFGNFDDKHDDVRYGVRCVPSPGCTPVLCQEFGGNTCEDNEHQFQILNHQSTNKKIETGNTVLLRSVRTPSHWLDCSDNTNCVISMCHEDNEEDPGNSSYISNCSKHHFEVLGYNRPLNKLLSTNHKLQFRNNSGYLNCNGKRCGLLAEDSCPNEKNRVVTVTETDGQCPVERYEILKLSEI